VVDGFERDYICRALSRHGGNVAQAARACAKHRRAFWALMQKHGIEAAPYRHAAHVRRLLG
jgi:DNA-binding NtrC family response regulator